ncbi:uncharacterized protein LOC112431850 [Maylandia zebra]|nr:probable E3 ubiquitin-protein ligase ARI7 [Maylandia zebra]
MSSISKTKEEKCYNSTFNLVDREDELDFYCDVFASGRALMSCGHAVTPSSLTNWCLWLLEEGESNFVCALPGCDIIWPYEEVCKMALLTPEEKEYFGQTMALNAMKHHFDYKLCPGCSSSVVRKDVSNLSVCCSWCSKEKDRTYEFCWQCLKEWKGPRPRSDRCDNVGCSNETLQILKNCEDIIFESVNNVSGCPCIRACPTCGVLVEHNKKECKNIVCPTCKKEFCFVCLKLTSECAGKRGMHFGPCADGMVAPRQTSIPTWQKQ